MNKVRMQNLAGILKKINKNVIVSFLLIVTFLVVTLSVVFIDYRKKENRFASKKLDTVFSNFVSVTSRKIAAFCHSKHFEHYIHSGPKSRERLYTSILLDWLFFELDPIVGFDIFQDKTNIFSYGKKTVSMVVLDLNDYDDPYLNAGGYLHKLKLYFDINILAKELKKFDPELVECDDCSRNVITGKSFGYFPILQSSGVKVNLKVRNNLSTSLWKILFFVVGSLLTLIIWDINRIKNIFRRYLSDPIVEITSRIKGNKNLPQTEVEELSYLTKQIDQWKKQVVGLEKAKANERAGEEKIKMMQSIGASIAHELRTPLRSIMSVVSGIEKLLPDLLYSYNLAKEANLPIKVISQQKIDQLHQVLVGLKKEGASANIVVDMFLMKMRGIIADIYNMEQLSIIDCINEAIERYPFQEKERDLIVFDTNNNFQFKGDKILVVHILFNLLKNALYYISSARKGKVYICLENNEEANILSFKDTGKGIAKDILPRIFDRFYSKTEGGTGIGLSFCKMAMEWMGGRITCKSIEGKYTEFILYFPKIEG